MKRRRLLGVLGASGAVLAASPADAYFPQVVITGSGVFSNCAEAEAFRDGPLVAQLDVQYARYQAGVQARYAAAIAEFNKHRAGAQSAFEAASRKQKSEVAIAVGQFIALQTISRLISKSLDGPDWSSVPKAQKDILADVGTRSADLSLEIVKAGFQGKAELAPFLEAHGDLLISVLSLQLGPAAKPLVDLAAFSADVGLIWATHELDKDDALADAESLRRAIDRMITASPQAKVAAINATKREIDEACK